jgi:protein-disulfide isomerase
MRLKYVGISVFVLSLLAFEVQVFAEKISPQETQRLQKFIKRTFGARMPEDAKIEVKGYEASPVKGFKKGSFAVSSSRGSGDVPFLISGDSRYIVLGESIDTGKFEDTKVPGIRKGQVNIGRQAVPILMSNDGKYLILGELIDSTVNPLDETMKKISLKDVPVKGNKDAKVTIVEYSDFQCPFCKRATDDVLPGILKEYQGKVKLVFKQFPLPNHPWANDAAIASVCAYKQGNDGFWKFHDIVFQKQKEITAEKSKEQLKTFAKQIGLDTGKFEACFNSPDTATRVQNELKEGQSIGINSTPTFVVNGMSVPGANPEGIKAAIKASLSGES